MVKFEVWSLLQSSTYFELLLLLDGGYLLSDGELVELAPQAQGCGGEGGESGGRRAEDGGLVSGHKILQVLCNQCADVGCLVSAPTAPELCVPASAITRPSCRIDTDIRITPIQP